MKTVIGGALGAYLLLGAVAHAQPAHNPPSGLNPEPRFKLEALRFKALNETGLDVWPLSDEVYVSIHVPTHRVATRSKIYNDVDAGETKHFPRSKLHPSDRRPERAKNASRREWRNLEVLGGRRSR
jgi:hypothetical protein